VTVQIVRYLSFESLVFDFHEFDLYGLLFREFFESIELLIFFLNFLLLPVLDLLYNLNLFLEITQLLLASNFDDLKLILMALHYELHLADQLCIFCDKFLHFCSHFMDLCFLLGQQVGLFLVHAL
jgi:hypothetical protein